MQGSWIQNIHFMLRGATDLQPHEQGAVGSSSWRGLGCRVVAHCFIIAVAHYNRLVSCLSCASSFERLDFLLRDPEFLRQVHKSMSAKRSRKTGIIIIIRIQRQRPGEREVGEKMCFTSSNRSTSASSFKIYAACASAVGDLTYGGTAPLPPAAAHVACSFSKSMP